MSSSIQHSTAYLSTQDTQDQSQDSRWQIIVFRVTNETIEARNLRAEATGEASVILNYVDQVYPVALTPPPNNCRTHKLSLDVKLKMPLFCHILSMLFSTRFHKYQSCMGKNKKGKSVIRYKFMSPSGLTAITLVILWLFHLTPQSAQNVSITLVFDQIPAKLMKLLITKCQIIFKYFYFHAVFFLCGISPLNTSSTTESSTMRSCFCV